MKVYKFGGTSIGNPSRMREVVELIRDDEQKIVVLSAIAGTTNKLVNLTRFLYENNREAANRLISDLEEEYQQFIKELYTDAKYAKKAKGLLKNHLNYLSSFTKDLFTLYEEKAVLAQGELLSSGLFLYLLEESGVKAALIQALDFMRLDKNNEPDQNYIREQLASVLDKHTKGESIVITQGYICRNEFGEIDNLKRGGSDYTASLIGEAVQAREIQIWTDIDGMHTNDPRVVQPTFPVHELSFDEAAELAYFGAKILHPSSILPAKRADVPVTLKNTMDPAASGTKITSSTSTEKAIKAVAAKDGITALKIKSGRMLMAYGFLRTVFEIFECYKTPIDMITTSEVAVSVTIDDDTYINSIVEELSAFGKVEVDKEQTIICIVGDFIAERSGFAIQIFEALKGIPVRMISYGGSKHNISVLVNTVDKTKALVSLNKHLFEGHPQNV